MRTVKPIRHCWTQIKLIRPPGPTEPRISRLGQARALVEKAAPRSVALEGKQPLFPNFEAHFAEPIEGEEEEEISAESVGSANDEGRGEISSDLLVPSVVSLGSVDVSLLGWRCSWNLRSNCCHLPLSCIRSCVSFVGSLGLDPAAAAFLDLHLQVGNSASALLHDEFRVSVISLWW